MFANQEAGRPAMLGLLSQKFAATLDLSGVIKSAGIPSASLVTTCGMAPSGKATLIASNPAARHWISDGESLVASYHNTPILMGSLLAFLS